jgi:ATP-binding cassette ChvD family protein
MAQYIYTMNRVAKVVPPKRQIIHDISLSFFPGAKIGVLGLNGSGKSTLLRIMAGLDTEIDGEARPQPGIKIGYLPQEPELDPAKDVRGNVEDGVAETKGLVDRFNEISEKFAEPMSDDEMNALLEEQGKLQDAIDAAGAWELDRKLEIAADALRLPPWEADVSKLSGGEKRRVALCRLLLSQPDMLLLDEPTNHLDAESVAWLERFLDEYPSTVIAVTHDRYFLDNVAGWILELDRGHGIPWEGNYSSWLEQKENRLANEEASEKARRKAMQAELEWVRSNPKGRHAKSKARLRQFEEISSSNYQKRNETNEIYIPPGPRLGDVVIEVENLRKGFGDKLLIDDLSFQLPPGGIAGVIGPNGAGKTTLFRMITGEEKPDAGSIRGKRFPTARTSSRSATTKRHRGDTSGGSISAVRSSSRRSACSRAASATACISQKRCAPAATFCYSTSPPTISMSRPCVRWSRHCSSSRGRRLSSLTIAGSSTGSARISSHSRVTPW